MLEAVDVAFFGLVALHTADSALRVRADLPLLDNARRLHQVTTHAVAVLRRHNGVRRSDHPVPASLDPRNDQQRKQEQASQGHDDFLFLVETHNTAPQCIRYAASHTVSSNNNVMAAAPKAMLASLPGQRLRIQPSINGQATIMPTNRPWVTTAA